jgi:hypothetical protein
MKLRSPRSCRSTARARRDDLDAAFEETLALMRRGPEIYQGVLLADGLVGMPDLLIREEARPDWAPITTPSAT